LSGLIFLSMTHIAVLFVLRRTIVEELFVALPEPRSIPSDMLIRLLQARLGSFRLESCSSWRVQANGLNVSSFSI
jgi:hypothetical protein